MVGFAGCEISLFEKVEGGTLHEHLMSQWRQDFFHPDKMPPELVGVPCPESVRYIWEYFLSMGSRRTSNGFGLNPVSQGDVTAWERRRRLTLLPFEHLMLDRLESVFLRIRNKPKDKS